MKTIKLLLGAVLLPLGALVIFIGVALFTRNIGWQSGGFAIAALAIGLTFIAWGWAVLRGDRLRDVWEAIISSLMW